MLLNKVDLIGGDGNKHAFYHPSSHQLKCKTQGFMGIQNSLINLYARSYVSQYNEGSSFASRAEFKVFDNSSYTIGNSSEADIDCMLVQTLSFGMTPGVFAARQDIRKRVLEMMQAAWFPQRGGPPGSYAESLVGGRP